MRLFYAINFNEKEKSYFLEAQKRIKEVSTKASFTLKDNFHLTLNFVGETTNAQLNDLLQKLEAINTKPFTLKFNRLDTFRGDLWYVAAKENNQLTKLNNYLSNSDKNRFLPHVTIARRVLLKDHVIDKDLEKLTVEVNKISLMESKRIDGRLTYIEVASKSLNH
jgi:2'-5' RNA ligase